MKLPIPEIKGINFQEAKNLTGNQQMLLNYLHNLFHVETDRCLDCTQILNLDTIPVALNGRTPVGYGCSTGGEFVHELYVARAYRKQGIGEALLIRCIAPFFEHHLLEHTIRLDRTYAPMRCMLRKMQKSGKWSNYFDIQIQNVPPLFTEENFHPDASIIRKGKLDQLI